MEKGKIKFKFNLKVLKGIIVFILLVIVVFSLTGCEKNDDNNQVNIDEIFNEVSDLTNSVQTKIENIASFENIVDGFDGNTVVDNKGDIKFKGYSVVEWKKMIDKFYKDIIGITLTDIEVGYNEFGIFEALCTTQFSVEGQFTFDEDTGYGYDYSGTNMIVDFINCKRILPIKYDEIGFTDNLCLAIGYVNDFTEKEFTSKYFVDNSMYTLPWYDFRHPEMREPGYGNRFVIIPNPKENVEITVYDVYYDDNDMELHRDNTLVHCFNEAFVMEDDYVEVVPLMLVEYKVGDFTDWFYITFSGEDGKLVLAGHESEVRDITIYHDFEADYNN